jgi:hypothetical protein
MVKVHPINPRLIDPHVTQDCDRRQLSETLWLLSRLSLMSTEGETKKEMAI